MNPQSAFLLLDGATGSNLIEAGLPPDCCPEVWTLDHPEALLALQRGYKAAGAQVVLAPTFGANPHKLAPYGLTEETERLNRELVALSRSAVGEGVAVAGDLSPSGLFLQPFGEATFDDLTKLYDRQLAALQAAGVTLAVIETQMTLADARAALLCAKRRGMTAFVTITVEPSGRTLTGLSLPSAVVTLQAMGAAAVGLNCSFGPAGMAPLLSAAAPYAKVPLVAKPNAGEAGAPLPPQQFAKLSAALAAAGAAVLGGCCGTTPAHIAALSARLAGQTPPAPAADEKEEFLADEKAVYPCPASPMSETLACGPDLPDDLAELSPETDLVTLTLETPAEADYLPEALPLCRGPVCFSSPSPAALEAALRAYQGRALVTGDGVTDRLIAEYGALPLQKG